MNGESMLLKHLVSPSLHKDVLLLLAIATLLVAIVSSVVIALVSANRKRRGVPFTTIELSADDRRFLDRFFASRITGMSIVYALTLAIVFGLLWIIAK